MTRAEVNMHNARAIARHHDKEQRAEKHYVCPVCKREVAAQKGTACVECAVRALSKAGWL